MYHCRHCVAARTPSEGQPAEARAGEGTVDPDTAPRDSVVDAASHADEAATTGLGATLGPVVGRERKQPKVFAFDGLRSHAKEKYVCHVSHLLPCLH